MVGMSGDVTGWTGAFADEYGTVMNHVWLFECLLQHFHALGRILAGLLS